MILIKGGKSPIEFRQSVGRGLRRTENKDKVIVFDFNISNIELLEKHCSERVDIYRSIYNNINFLEENVL
jgi:superfamily II DNA or RNA helicase